MLILDQTIEINYVIEIVTLSTIIFLSITQTTHNENTEF